MKVLGIQILQHEDGEYLTYCFLLKGAHYVRRFSKKETLENIEAKIYKTIKANQ